jgi:hypothetical protein
MKQNKNTLLYCKDVVKRIVSAASVIAIIAGLGNIAHAAPASPWEFHYAKYKFRETGGITASYQGVPVIRQSSLYVIKPGWNGTLYNYRNNKQVVEKQADGSLHVIDANQNFRAEYTLRLLDAQTFEIHFRGELLQDIPADIEFNAGLFNAALIANRSYRALFNDGNRPPVSGIVPSFPVKIGLEDTDLAPGFQTLEFDSRLGKMTISVHSHTPFTFSDARKYPMDWAEETPVFWCGWLAGMQPLRANKPVEATLTIRIEPSATPVRKEAAPVNNINNVDDAFVAVERPTQIVPQPKRMQLQAKSYFVMSHQFDWRILAPAGETRLAPAVEKLLNEEWHLQSALPRRDKSTSNAWCGIRIGSNEPISIPASLAHADWAGHPDSYRLTVGKDGVLIIAPTARGAFYGVQTLAQLLYFEKTAVAVPYVTIEDWPTLQFRGVSWYPSQSGVAFDKKLIGIMARSKFNYTVIACERVRWDSHPEIAASNSISKKDLQELVDLCRANFIEPIPLIDGPGHASWVFANKQNLDLAEDPQTPYAYTVNNPKSFQLVHDVMAEAIAIFHPKFFHVGMDEVAAHGRFPNPDNPLNPPGETDTNLLLKYLNTQHAWLEKQGIKTMIWSDMCLNHNEGVTDAAARTVEQAKQLRAAIPKDVIVCDWHYENANNYPSLSLFQNEGLKTVAATWYKPLNIRGFIGEAIKTGAWGILQTTWAGAFPDETTLETEKYQFTAYILAADYSWSGRSELPDALPYDSTVLWNRFYAASVPASRAGATLSLGPVANVPAQDWLGLGKNWDLTDFFADQKGATPRRLGNILFNIPDHRLVVLSNAPTALAPEGALSKVTLEINHRVSEIAFLHTTLWNVPQGVTAARCTVEYADGSHADIDFNVGSNILPWYGQGNTGDTLRAWVGQSPADIPLRLRAFRWVNPHSEKIITQLTLQPIAPQAGYALAGITLVY